MAASAAIFLFGWGGRVIARIPPCRLSEAGPGWRAGPVVRHRGSGHPSRGTVLQA